MAPPKVTVIFLLYNASKTVEMLVDAVVAQKHPSIADQSEWMEVLFMDDRSRDDTVEKLEKRLAKLGHPKHCRVVKNDPNLGLSKTYNKAFQLARAPYGLTCHCDVIFGKPEYVASMLALMEKYPDAAAITGQIVLPSEQSGAPLPFAEKVNTIANLADIFPPGSEKELIPVGFAEGRCDIFRIEALRAVGFYDTTLRVAGEDQVIAAKFRKKGYQVYQAPHLPYYLSVSDEQDTLTKLLKHQMLYGRAHPYILIKNRKTSKGVVGNEAGANRQARTALRALQLVSAMTYLWAVASIIAGLPAVVWIGPLMLAFLAKSLLFVRHFQSVHLNAVEYLGFYAFQPLLDLAYTIGLIQGVLLLLRGSTSRPIS